MKAVRFALPLLLAGFSVPLSAADSPAPPAATPRSEPADLASLRTKAERGNSIAQYNLGLAYTQGRQVPADYPEAYAWLSIAASQISATRQRAANARLAGRVQVYLPG